MKKILFTGGGGAGNIEIWNKLKKKYSLYFADSNISSIHPDIPRARKISIKSAKSNSFNHNLSRIVKKKKIDLIVPAVDEEILKIISDKFLFKKSFLPDLNFIKNTIDKKIFFDNLKNKKINYPQTYSSLSSIGKKNFKLLLKPRFGRGSRNVHVINKISKINSYLDLYDLKLNDVVIQKYIKGTEYTVYVGCNKKKEVERIFPLKVGIKKGITIKAFYDKNPSIIHFIKKFSKIFKTKNSYNLQLIISNNKIYPIEINPRISTTFFMCLQDNYDPFQNVKNKKKIIINKKKISLSRHWKNFIK